MCQHIGQPILATLSAQFHQFRDLLTSSSLQAATNIVFGLGQRAAIITIIQNGGIKLTRHQHQPLHAFVWQLLAKQTHIRLIEKLAAAGEKENHITVGHI
ncbi:MAG: hypothetical protein ACRDCQ_19860, partial [Aeromonas sobria]